MWMMYFVIMLVDEDSSHQMISSIQDAFDLPKAQEEKKNFWSGLFTKNEASEDIMDQTIPEPESYDDYDPYECMSQQKEEYKQELHHYLEAVDPMTISLDKDEEIEMDNEGIDEDEDEGHLPVSYAMSNSKEEEEMGRDQESLEDENDYIESVDKDEMMIIFENELPDVFGMIVITR